MKGVLTVKLTADGQHQIAGESGHLIAGPFPTNAEAWAALDNLVGERPMPKRAKGPKIKGREKTRAGKLSAPGDTSIHQPREEGTGKRNGKYQCSAAAENAAKQKEQRRMQINAAKAPGWIRSGAMGKFDPAGARAYRDHKLGTFGPASECKRIDPAVYLAEKAAKERCR